MSHEFGGGPASAVAAPGEHAAARRLTLPLLAGAFLLSGAASLVYSVDLTITNQPGLDARLEEGPHLGRQAAEADFHTLTRSRWSN